MTVGVTDEWQSAADSYKADPDKRFYLYNSNRPATGSFATEDDGVALWVLAWAQYKMKVDRWFYWEATYYNNYQGNTGQADVFSTAQTFGDLDEVDPVLGETGWNYLNGDGVLMYPGTDLRYPEADYGVMGPFASLRLKHWRRGIQDADYLTLAEAISPTRTAEIVDAMVPKILWEYGVSDLEDPSWVSTDISWSTDPDDWEAARAALAGIIEYSCAEKSHRVHLPVVTAEATSYVSGNQPLAASENDLPFDATTSALVSKDPAGHEKVSSYVGQRPQATYLATGRGFR
jgi:hypothetical protein